MIMIFCVFCFVISCTSCIGNYFWHKNALDFFKFFVFMCRCCVSNLDWKCNSNIWSVNLLNILIKIPRKFMNLKMWYFFEERGMLKFLKKHLFLCLEIFHISSIQPLWLWRPYHRKTVNSQCNTTITLLLTYRPFITTDLGIICLSVQSILDCI